jgi:hypothetical protein
MLSLNASPRLVKAGQLLTVMVTIPIAIRTFYFIPATEFDSISTTIESFLLFILSGMSLLNLSRSSQSLLLSDYRFWIVSSSLIYFCITIVVFSSGNIFLGKTSQLADFTWVLNIIFSIVANIMYFIGMLFLPAKKDLQLKTAF